MKNTIGFGIALATMIATAADVNVDFAKETAAIRPALHSSGWTPRVTAASNPQSNRAETENVKALNMMYTRTHDWALINPGQRMVDVHFIFPLMHLDAKDPKNYVFGPTDNIIGRARETGLEIFYRLGTSIEHTGPKLHFNSLIPADFDKVAEVFAGTIRHYNRGWADGKEWNIKYWEIWNEPDGFNNMWCEPGGDEGKEKIRREKFVRFFVTCLKRIKSEFPEVKVGGPALCWMNEAYFKEILTACKAANVTPDFISWHYYGKEPADMVFAASRARALCDSFGFTACELIINEWHYMDSAWTDLRNPNPAVVARVQNGPTGHNNIDSATFTISALMRFQTSKLDQAYYYGCSHVGAWGYMDENKRKNKNYFACKLFGSVVRDYKTICVAETDKPGLTTLAVKSADGTKYGLLVADYRGTDQMLEIDVKGLPENCRTAEAITLDDTRDALPCDVRFRNNRLTLVKPDKYSAVWLVTFNP